MTTVPIWIGEISPYQIASINKGGVGGGAFMPAASYYEASLLMSKYGNRVLDYLYESGVNTYTIDVTEDSWDGTAQRLLALAVEYWCAANEELADWDDMDPIESEG